MLANWRRAQHHARLFTVIVMTVLLAVTIIRADETTNQLPMMLEEIARDFRMTADLTGREKMQPAVHRAMALVPRHEFVKENYREQAYVNRPLSIGHGQTISQPYIVAIMTDLLDPQPGHRVLEIGTGSGYQAAILAEIVDQVFSIEIIDALAVEAAERLNHLGYDNVSVRSGDGNYGWPEEAPFDSIIVTAAGNLPRNLVEQLKTGGRMVIPLEGTDGGQDLVVVTKNADGLVSSQSILPVRFVPLTGDN